MYAHREIRHDLITSLPSHITNMNIARYFYRKGRTLWFVLRHPQLHRAFRITTHLSLEERVTLYHLATSAQTIAEIGSYLGASACCFGAAHRRRSSGTIICIDTWANDAMTEGKRDTWLEFTSNTEPYSQFIVPVRGLSTDVISRIREQWPRLDLLFIDGDHSYEAVKADWDAYKALLQPNGVVAFHDYGWADGVRRVVHEDVLPITKNHRQLRNMWWATIR